MSADNRQKLLECIDKTIQAIESLTEALREERHNLAQTLQAQDSTTPTNPPTTNPGTPDKP